MNTEFSETTYSFAFLFNLNRAPFGNFEAVPILPSTYQEGRTGGGYDAEVIYNGFPILFQFKIPRVMRKNSPKNGTSFDVPYYRMYLNPTEKYRQHKMLLRHQRNGYLVFYASPWFHTIVELNDLYLNNRVWHQSLLITPYDLGIRNYRQGHFVAYDRYAQNLVVCSKPRKLAGSFNAKAFVNKIDSIFKKRISRKRTIGIMEGFFELLIDIIFDDNSQNTVFPDINKVRDMGSFYGSEFLARHYLNCQIVFLNRIEI